MSENSMEREENGTAFAGAPTRRLGGACALCGLPVGGSGVKQAVNGESLEFCCPGCRYVYQILSSLPGGPPADFKETEIYRACVASGLISQVEGDPARFGPANVDEKGSSAPPSAEEDEALTEELTLRIQGMWCTACSWLIESVVGRMDGVREARVYFLSDMARLKYMPHRVSPEDLAARIERLGYRAAPFEDHPQKREDERRLLFRLGISSILTMNIMMISFALYFGFFEDIGKEAVVTLSYPLLILATPVVFYGGFPIMKRAAKGLRFGAASMDALIAIGALSAYAYSVVGILNGSIRLYFDTAAMLVTLVLLGRYIESRARDKVARGIMGLYALAGLKVRALANGTERWVSSESVLAGDEFLVSAEERIPLDGEIVLGEAKIDESILTGESRPVRKKIGDQAMGGALVLDGELRLKATRVGEESSLNRMIALIQEALSGKDSVELLADRVTRWFVPAILALATGTALGLLFGGASLNEAVLRGLTVLVITCPCALGIAAPLAKVAAVGHARTKGMLIRDLSALEKAKDIEVLVFDKTGTLTEGKFSLLETFAPGVPGNVALGRVASVEAESGHFLAKEILRRARREGVEIERASSIESFPGLGVRGVAEGTEILVGNRGFLESLGMEIPRDISNRSETAEAEGATSVFFGWEREAKGVLVFGDKVREGAGESIRELQRRGVEVWMVSGDSEATTRAVAARLGISNFVGRALPSEKAAIIERLGQGGRRTGMVGDGINDAAALARAHVGFAAGAGSNILQEASDVTLLGEDAPGRALSFLELSALTSRVIRQNLFFALLYNMLGVPLAMAGLLNPLVAVFAMFASSLTVIGNTLRISGSDSAPETPGAGSPTGDLPLEEVGE